MKLSLIAGAIIRPVGFFVAYLLLAARFSMGYVFGCVLAAMAVSILPALCGDPAREAEKEGAPEPRRSFDRLAQLRSIFTFLIILWVVGQPEIFTFLHTLAPRLWDWRLITCAAIVCAIDLFRSLRSALAYRPSHLYPGLSQSSKRPTP